MALHSASGALATANTRPTDTPVLKPVGGASLSGILLVFTSLTDERLASDAPSEPAADGNSFAALTSCPSELENTVPIILLIFKSASRGPRRLASGGATSRGMGVTSSRALASSTPPLPSSAAW